MQVISNPEEIRRFQASLRQFNGEVQSSTSRVRAQLLSLGETWRDQEYQRFATDLQEVIQTFERYLQSADGYLHHLDMKAEPLERFLGH